MSNLKKRKRVEARLKIYGVASITVALLMLATLLISISLNGYSAFRQAYFKISIPVDISQFATENGSLSSKKLNLYDWDGLVNQSFNSIFPDITKRSDKRKLFQIISSNSGYDLKQIVKNSEYSIGQKNIVVWLPLSDDADQYLKGRFNIEVPEEDRRLNDKQIIWIDTLVAKDLAKLKFNKTFFTAADSREPESAGILGAVVGSSLTLFVTILFALPLAVMASIYLEYFARPGRITDFIEVNINNLAAVPSIVFGLLGLSVLLSTFGLPR